MNLDKPMFDVEAKEEEALYKRSLEVCCLLQRGVHILYFEKCS
jgi:hypothetical protein